MKQILSTICFLGLLACQKQPVIQPEPKPKDSSFGKIDYWETNGDQSKLLTKASTQLNFISSASSNTIIEVDTAQLYQSIDGFGYTLTEGAAFLIKQMDANSRIKLLEDIFGNKEGALSVNYIRISLGASDLSTSVYTYNDLPTGQSDETMQQFSLGKDTLSLVPILKQIIAINPSIKIMASPWSAPSWMKDNGTSIGGTLKQTAFAAYAKYFVKYIQSMQGLGIPISAVTLQNEPENPYNNPSMLLSAAQAIDFVKNYLGPAFQQNNLQTKIIIWDHNCDHPAYPVSVLSDPAANAYITGTAFHLYGGDISAMSYVHTMFPEKKLYFTEQWTSATGNFKDDFIWHMKNVIVGSMRNWSSIALEWNLANDVNYGPHTNGGCTACKGAYTIMGNDYAKNVSYYIIGQIAPFALPNSTRIASTEPSTLSTVAFLRPDGKKCLVVVNVSNQPISFAIQYKNKFANTLIGGNTAITYLW